MNREGYSLADTLAAMLIIGLAMVGLFQGVGLIARTQTTNNAEALANQRSRAVQRGLDTLFASHTHRPIGGLLVGEPSAIAFPCDAANCSARLTRRHGRTWLEVRHARGRATALVAPTDHPVSFRFASRAQETDRWPAADAPAEEPLRGVRIVDGEQVVAAVTLRVEQSPDCIYDLVTHACRTP
ncbi:MAG TPA: hypothetical protein VEA44_15980 [Caulobacter sp.]|nr:hypothetical protein [Caulobacter sp.]